MDMKNDIKQYTAANREAWEQVASLHQQAKLMEWDNLFNQPGFSCLPSVQMEILSPLLRTGCDVVQLACNNGVELLSLKNLGAGRCVGIDISSAFIDEAKARAQRTDIDCQYYCQDIYDNNTALQLQFDLVYLSVGCLGWMPDLNRFFEIASSMLRSGGHIFIHEMHPFSDLLATDQSASGDRYHISQSYFCTKPTVLNESLDYMGGQSYEAKTQYWFTHTLSDIFNAIRIQGFNLLRFDEYAEDLSLTLKEVEQGQYALPLSYRLLAKKS